MSHRRETTISIDIPPCPFHGNEKKQLRMAWEKPMRKTVKQAEKIRQWLC
jgi:hypothetical protein